MLKYQYASYLYEYVTHKSINLFFFLTWWKHLAKTQLDTLEKNTFFNKKTKIKTIATTVMKYESKYSPMSEGNTCIAEPNLEVLTLT